MSIYSTFYRDRKTEGREALEVFLTHALTDLLNRISRSNPASVEGFVSEVLLDGRTHGKAAEISLQRLQKRLQVGDLDWESQPKVALDEGIKRADISLSVRGDPLHPLLVVEAKV